MVLRITHVGLSIKATPYQKLTVEFKPFKGSKVVWLYRSKELEPAVLSFHNSERIFLSRDFKIW